MRHLVAVQPCASVYVQGMLSMMMAVLFAQDYISFRHHTYEQPKGIKSIQLTEVGPRFEAKVYQVKLGTLDQQHAENEWVVHAYTRSAKKAKLAAVDSE